MPESDVAVDRATVGRLVEDFWTRVPRGERDFPDFAALSSSKTVPLYAARIEDLGPGDFVKVDCAACCRRLPRSSAELRRSHTALLVREADRLALRAKLAPVFLHRLGLSPQDKVLDLKDRVRCRGCGARGCAAVSIVWAKRAA
jgi:hypothetical protein